MGYLSRNWRVETFGRELRKNPYEVRFKFLALGDICGTALMVNAHREKDGKFRKIEFDRDELRSLLQELRRALPLQDRTQFALETIRELDEPAFLSLMAELCRERADILKSRPAE